MILSLAFGACFSSWAYQNPEDAKSSVCPQLDTAKNRLEDARKLLDDELYHSSVTILNEALEAYRYCMDGTDSNKRVLVQINYWLGYAHFHLSNYEKALYYFKRALFKCAL